MVQSNVMARVLGPAKVEHANCCAHDCMFLHTSVLAGCKGGSPQCAHHQIKNLPEAEGAVFWGAACWGAACWGAACLGGVLLGVEALLANSEPTALSKNPGEAGLAGVDCLGAGFVGVLGLLANCEPIALSKKPGEAGLADFVETSALADTPLAVLLPVLPAATSSALSVFRLHLASFATAGTTDYGIR